VDTLSELLWMMNEELVLQAVQLDWGFDTAVLAANLALPPEKRLQRGIERARRTRQRSGESMHPNARARPIPAAGTPVLEFRAGDLHAPGRSDEPS
jgi:hypothetical protein